MRSLRTWFFGLLIVALLAWVSPLAAQQGTLTGRVTNSEDGSPVEGAQVQVLGAGAGVGAVSNTQGVFSIQLPPGTYTVVVDFIGYVIRRVEGIRILAGQTTSHDVELTTQAVAMDAIVVTASRKQEKMVEAPATVFLVGTTRIQEHPTATPVDHLRGAPGVDIISEGIQSTNVVVRGFNNIFSGALHALTDHRLAGVPSLRVNLLHFIPSNNEDIERMEVVLGPGSALYGPNTADGVLHILTKSPLDSAGVGTTVTLGGGERSLFQGAFRSAYLVNRNLGVKFSGQYIRGNDWRYTDIGEQAARDAADANPAVCQTGLLIRGYNQAAAAEACARVGVRDFDLERYGFEARADYRFAPDGTAILSYGRTDATGIELTGLGAGQTQGWIYQFFQARMTKGRFFAQAYLNTSDAGEGTFLLRDGVPLVDKSKLFVAQAQHGFSIFDDRQDFTYGIDIFRTRPDTEGTINGVYEGEDNMDEWGVYLQSKTALAPKLDLILAARVDDHSMLPDKVFSPRAGLLFKPTENQSFRVTYNRAFSTPTSLNFFLDISAGLAPDARLAALGYTVRAFGTGRDGYSYQNADGSLKGMRTPFLPGQFLPASPTVMWPLALGVLQQQIALGALPASLGALLPVLAGLNPTGNDLGINLLNTSSGATTPLESTTIPAVEGMRESNTETFEVGWQGILGGKLRIAADAYYTKKNDFGSPLLVTNPLLLLNGPDVKAFITAPIEGAIYQQILAANPTLPPSQIQQLAQAQAAPIVAQLAAGIGQIPLGVAATEEIASQEADLIVTYFNIGSVDYYGADLAFEYFLDKFTFSGSYSWVEKDWFPLKGAAPIALNAPRNKGSLGLAYRDPALGFNAEARLRYHARFPAESAGYRGTLCVKTPPGAYFQEECVGSSRLVDLNMGYRLPTAPATLQVSVTNLFNKPYRSFVGVPEIGRLAMVSLKYELF